jgi:hypothetical protein
MRGKDREDAAGGKEFRPGRSPGVVLLCAAAAGGHWEAEAEVLQVLRHGGEVHGCQVLRELLLGTTVREVEEFGEEVIAAAAGGEGAVGDRFGCYGGIGGV